MMIQFLIKITKTTKKKRQPTLFKNKMKLFFYLLTLDMKIFILLFVFFIL